MKSNANSKIIRRPDFAGGGVTEDELARMKTHSEEWIRVAYRTETANLDKISSAIYGLYAAANLPAPLAIVLVPSPLVMAVAGSLASTVWALRDKGISPTPTDLLGTIIHQRKDQFHDAVLAACGSVVGASRYDNTILDDTPIVEPVTPAFYTSLLKRFIPEKCHDTARETSRNWSACYQGGNMWVSFECYLTATRDILGLRLPEHEKYKYWEAAAKEGGFRYMHEKFCMVSDFPLELHVDDRYRPHCETGPSHRWRDGWSIYHWHGVKIPQDWIEDRAKLTANRALSEANIELRRAACEIVGWPRILQQLNAKVIDRDIDPQIGELIEVNLPDAGRTKFLRVLCGTGREFAIPVPSNMRTALEANAATYNIPVDFLKQKEVRT